MRAFLKLLHRLALWLFWPAVLLVTWGELTPSPPSLEVHVWDKLLHFTAYFGLAGMATLSIKSRRILLYALLALIAFGGLLEIVQGMTGRDADVFDELANSLGVISGALVGLALIWLVEDRPRD